MALFQKSARNVLPSPLVSVCFAGYVGPVNRRVGHLSNSKDQIKKVLNGPIFVYWTRKREGEH